MDKLTAVVELNPADYMVIDKDTGTVLGTNLVIVPTATLTEEDIERIESSDSEAFQIGESELAQALYVKQ